MPRINLTGGAYTARSLTVGAQRCLNLYPEIVPQAQGEPVQVTHYPTAGLRTLVTPGTAGAGRGLYRASNGDLYAVVGANVYYVSPDWRLTTVGSISPNTTPVSMTDNGIDAVLVDNSAAGYQISLADRTMVPIADEAFYGATRTDVLDTFILFNRPGTNQFYTTLSNTITPLDPLYIAGKSGFPDPLVSLIVCKRQIWLIGEVTSEFWYDSGSADFPFQIMQGPYVPHGCAAPYSVAQQDGAVFWLSLDANGSAVIVRGYGYDVKRISTHAIEVALSSYPTVSDAVALTYQQQGHAFYQISFPSADRTWVWDDMTGLWHEKAWTDDNGVDHRHRAQCAAYAYGTNVCLDWQNGTLYAFDPAVFTDAGQAIKRVRSFPHLVNDGKRAFYTRFAADMQVGTSTDTISDYDQDTTLDIDSSGQELQLDGVGPALLMDEPPIGNPPPQIFLRWSDTQGVTWGDAIAQTLGATGEYLTQAQWQRLGMARSRVFELSWSAPVATTLTGAFIDVLPSGS